MQEKSILVGLVGAGIQASLTPRMHEKEGGSLGLRYMYKLIDLVVPIGRPGVSCKSFKYKIYAVHRADEFTPGASLCPDCHIPRMRS
jgi:shikimate 5-dehydrogenase